MKVAVSYKDGMIYAHFGHAEMFAIYEFKLTAPENVTKTLLQVDAQGHKAVADLMRDNLVDLVIVGHMGAEARNQLLAYGIVPLAGYSGSADLAVDKLIDGTLPIVDEGAGSCSGGCGGCCSDGEGGCGGCH